MINYIDTEKLKAEIERRKELLVPHKGQGIGLCREVIRQFDSLLSFIDTISQPIMKDDIIDEIRAEIERRFSEYNHDSNHHIQAAECASILDFIDSLQQEQPIGEEYTIEVGKHTHTLHVGSQSDIDNLIHQEKQEQPEVDLENEVEKFCLEYDSRKEVWFDMTPRDKKMLSIPCWANFAVNIARHFYELGLNARKK